LRAIRSKLSYANVIATIALFLALGGGAVFAASKIRSNQIAANAIKKKQLAKNSITSKDFRKKSLLVVDPVGGGQTLNVEPVPPATGFPLPLTGKTSFTAKGKEAGLLMAEARATLASNVAGVDCDPFVRIFVNGLPKYTLLLNNDPVGPATSTTSAFTDIASASAPIGLTQPGVAQVISAEYGGDPDCAATSKLDVVRIVVQRSV
jgi:hypothetical protein